MACLRSWRSGTGTTLAADTRHFRLLPGRPAASATKGENVMKRKTLTRRRFVAASAAASASMMAAPFVRSAHAAGKLSIGFWDHWVPGANDATKTLIEEWAAKEKVDVQIDFITSQGDKLLLTIAAESQAKSGHDILASLPGGRALRQQLEPVDDVMDDADQGERRHQRHGRLSRQGRRQVARACRPPAAARSRDPAPASTS